MHPSIRADQNLRELALAEARNAVGPDEPLQVFLQQECLTAQEYADISKNPTYQRYLKDFKAELVESGFSFSAKARVLAEDLLADIYLMAKDSDTPAQMRVKTLENLVEWGRLAPKITSNDAPGAGFSVTINLGNNNAPQSVTVTQNAPQPTPAATIDAQTDDVTDVTEKQAATAPLLEITRDAAVLSARLPDDVELYYEAEDADI